MDLINRERKVYGPPATLVASEPEWDIRATYRAGHWNETHECTLRGVTIRKLNVREGDHHVWCLFPDGRIMVVRESNIKAKQVQKYGGVKNVSTPKQ